MQIQHVSTCFSDWNLLVSTVSTCFKYACCQIIASPTQRPDYSRCQRSVDQFGIAQKWDSNGSTNFIKIHNVWSLIKSLSPWKHLATTKLIKISQIKSPDLPAYVHIGATASPGAAGAGWSCCEPIKPSGNPEHIMKYIEMHLYVLILMRLIPATLEF